MKVKIKEIFVRHGNGFRKYPFAFGEMFNNAGESLGSGFVPSGDAVINIPQMEELAQTEIDGNPMFDPDFLKTDTLATGIRYADQW